MKIEPNKIPTGIAFAKTFGISRIKNIGSYAFSHCSLLSSVTLPSSLTLIDDKAFYFCESLKKVINNSNLDIQIGAETHGYVAYYATEIITGTESGVSFTENFSTPIFSMKNGEIHFEHIIAYVNMYCKYKAK